MHSDTLNHVDGPLCIVMLRVPERTGEARLAERSRMLLDIIVEPTVRELGFHVEQLDPADFGINDQRLFQRLNRADLVIVDALARSGDYMYALGARHALTSRATVVLAESEYRAFDVQVPRGVFSYSSEELTEPFRLQVRFSEFLRRQVVAGEHTHTGFSPVKDALATVPRVFLSYAHADREAVLAVDQWLRDKGARVDLDERDFIAGGDIRDQIVAFIAAAGKVVCFYSENSADRYYTKLERRLVEEREQQLHSSGATKPILLYFRLDATDLPRESSFRLAVNAFCMGFEKACGDLWRHLLEQPAEPTRIDLAKYKASPPWARRSTRGEA